MASDENHNEPDLNEAYARTRRTLIERLQDWEDQKTWDEFYQTYWRLIYSVSMRAGLPSDEAFDVVQETVLSIAKQWKKGARYDADKGSFKSWLLNVAKWRIADQFRKRQRNPAANFSGQSQAEWDERSTAVIERFEDPDGVDLEKIWDAEWASNLSDAALERVKGKVSPRQFQIFDCYVVKGWDPAKVRTELGVSMAQVYLAKHRVGGLVKKEVEALQNQLL